MTKTFAIESNGFLEKTACYINGQQVGGLKEVFINIDEAGIFKYEMVHKLSEKIKNNQQATDIENMALTGILSTQLIYYQYITRKKFRPQAGELKNCRTFIDIT